MAVNKQSTAQFEGAAPAVVWSHRQKLLNLIGRDSRFQTENTLDTINTKCQSLISDRHLFTTLLFYSYVASNSRNTSHTNIKGFSFVWRTRSPQPSKHLRCCNQEIQLNNGKWKSPSTLLCLAFMQGKLKKKCKVRFHADLAVQQCRQVKSGFRDTSTMLQIRRHRIFELVKRYYNQDNPTLFQSGERYCRQDKNCPFELAVLHSTQKKTVSLS
jgi:hypothetical protein